MGLLSKLVDDFDLYHDELSRLGNKGYTIVVNVRGTIPELYHTTLPAEWVEEYVGEKYAYFDPVMHFTALFTGEKRWSEVWHLPIPGKTKKVYELAHNFNLNFGGAIVRKERPSGKKHLLSFARDDREPTDEEMRRAADLFDDLLASLKGELTERQLQCLHHLAQGLKIEEIADRVNYGRETVKRDLEGVRQMWNCKNNTEAVAQAVQRGLIKLGDGPKW